VDDEQMEQLTLNVTGMTCGGCENAVRRVVSALPGVGTVTASHKDDRVTVEYDAAKVNPAQIAQAVARAGYAVA
jgi:copper chaperone